MNYMKTFYEYAAFPNRVVITKQFIFCHQQMIIHLLI